MKKIDEILNGVSCMAIAGHVRPDGDCIGSCLGLYQYLRDNRPEIQADVYLEDPRPEFSYLPGFSEVKTSCEEKAYDLVVLLDVSSEERIGVAAPLLAKAGKTICIDHHETNTEYCEINHVEPDASSACEVLFGLLEEEKISEPRAEVSQYAPKMITMHIDPDKIREVIGKGGSVIQKIVAESGAKIDIDVDVIIHFASPDAESCATAKKCIDDIVFVPEVGQLYYGRVVRLMTFGAFVELAPGKDGLVHISKLADKRIEKVEDACKIGDMMWVKGTEIDEKGRGNLSHKDAMKEIAAKEAEIADQWDGFKQHMAAMQELRDGGSVAMLASVNDLYELLTFNEVMQDISIKDTEIMDNMKAAKSALEADKVALEAQRSDPAAETFPIISILTPLYNTPQYFLTELLDRVENQTAHNWQLCLADASDDAHTYVGELGQ